MKLPLIPQRLHSSLFGTMPSEGLSLRERLVRVRARLVRAVNKRREFPVELVGYDWKSPESMPIAVLFGFNPWKRQVVGAYLKGYKTAFVLGGASFRRLESKFLNQLPSDQEIVFISWGMKLPSSARRYIQLQRWIRHTRIKHISIEDGFLRSMGGGMLHTRPASLCIDHEGLYFDARSPSELEKILNEHDFSGDPAILERARKALDLMRAARLTKYYDARPYSGEKPPYKKTSRYSILVIGQVEDDASIQTGKTKIHRNAELVLQARIDFPNADIFFRPHPDYWNGTRKSRSNVEKLKSVCAIVPPETSLYDLFQVVDHVYTMTSLAGFEALIYGLRVTTFGAPFYSNWGLTDDRVKITRRKRTLTIEELFAAAYFLYPRYLNMVSDEPSTFEDTASYFIVEALKYGNVFDLDKNNVLFQKCQPHVESLSIPFQILSYLNGTGTFAAADTNRIIEMIEARFSLADYPQISHLLTITSNYDALVRYSNLCIAHLRDHVADLVQNTTLLENFFYSLTLALSNSNGRVIDKLPNINPWLLSLSASDDNFTRIVRNYIRCLSSGLQYEVIDDFLEEAAGLVTLAQHERSFSIHWVLEDIISETMAFGLTVGHYKSICQVLLQKPSRSERNFAKRHQLALAAADRYVSLLDVKHTTAADSIFNRVLYWALLDEHVQAAREFRNLIATFDWDGIREAVSSRSRSNLGNRAQELIGLGLYFVKTHHFDPVEKILSAFHDDADDESVVFLKLSYYKATGDRASFLKCYESLSRDMKETEKLLGLYARVLREMGLFERSRLCYVELAKRAKTLAKKVSIESDIQKIEFCQKSSRILNSVPQPSLPRGVVFLASQTCFNTLAMMVPGLVELKKKGYAVINLIEGMTEHEPTGLDWLDRFAGCIPLGLSYPHLKQEWEVDWPNRKVSASGINFYQGFYETLSVYARRFHVDINVPLVSRAFREKLLRADTCLWVCKDIYREVVARGVPTSFVSGNSHIAPFSVFRDFARSKDHPLLNFINCNVAYESYFSNLGSKFANTMCVTDMTLFPNIRAPFMARRDQFERWYDRNQDDPAFVEKARSLINVNRVGSTTNAKEQEIIEYIKSQKALGKKIICAFGKVPVDLNVPYDGGPAHSDMADWISNTVSICGDAQDLVLLVKPHPHELRPEIALDLVESFHDLIAVNVPENVLLLGHKDINGHALAPYLDLAILYNGSSGLELAAQGIPVIMTSHFGRHDYPVDLIYPESREQYREFLVSGNYPIPSKEVRKRAAFLICYLGTDEISILNQYSLRQLTNDKIGVPRWRMEKISHFMEHGDPKMTLIAERIVEKFERVCV